MSQISKLLTSSGPIPPIIPTSFTTDVRDNNSTLSPGTAVPVANNLQLAGRDTTQNNDNGIRTDTDPEGGKFVYIELTNRGTGTVITMDNTPTTIYTFPLGTTAGVYHFDGNIVVYNTTPLPNPDPLNPSPSGASYSFASAWRTDGATATEISTEFKDLFEEFAMTTADFNIDPSTNDIVFSVTGITGSTIHWNLFFTYRFVS